MKLLSPHHGRHRYLFDRILHAMESFIKFQWATTTDACRARRERRVRLLQSNIDINTTDNLRQGRTRGKPLPFLCRCNSPIYLCTESLVGLTLGYAYTTTIEYNV